MDDFWTVEETSDNVNSWREVQLSFPKRDLYSHVRAKRDKRKCQGILYGILYCACCFSQQSMHTCMYLKMSGLVSACLHLSAHVRK